MLAPLLAVLALTVAAVGPTAPAPTTRAGVVATAPLEVASVPVAYAGTVYLTFDDGPSSTYTRKVPAVL